MNHYVSPPVAIKAPVYFEIGAVHFQKALGLFSHKDHYTQNSGYLVPKL